MSGPGRKPLKRRVFDLELQVPPRRDSGPIILFEWAIPPGEKPKPYCSSGAKCSSFSSGQRGFNARKSLSVRFHRRR
jgi:hypothetical protein